MVIEKLNAYNYYRHWKQHPECGLTVAERRFQLLRLMLNKDGSTRPIWMNCEGGSTYDNVARKLVASGLARLDRVSVGGDKRHSDGIKPYSTMRTRLHITGKGKKEFVRLSKRYGT